MGIYGVSANRLEVFTGFLYCLPDVSEQRIPFIHVPNLIYIILNMILHSVK